MKIITKFNSYFFQFFQLSLFKKWMPIKLTYTSVQPTHYTHRKWWWTAQNISFFACFWSFLGLFLIKTRSARFGHLLISLACYIIKYECLKKIIGYGKVQAKSKIWQKTSLFRGDWRGSSTPTHWKKRPSAADYALRRFNWPSNTSKGYKQVHQRWRYITVTLGT